MVQDNETTLSLEEKMHFAQQGDKKIYAELLNDITTLVRGYLFKKINTPEDVEDVLQEILISIHNARHTYQSSRPLKPWIFAITKFRLTDHLRKIYRNKSREMVNIDEIEFSLTTNVTNDTDNYEELYKALKELPDKQRKIVELMKIEGYTAKEVAEKLDMTESAVKVSAHRSYKQLKTLLEQTGV